MVFRFLFAAALCGAFAAEPGGASCAAAASGGVRHSALVFRLSWSVLEGAWRRVIRPRGIVSVWRCFVSACLAISLSVTCVSGVQAPSEGSDLGAEVSREECVHMTEVTGHAVVRRLELLRRLGLWTGRALGRIRAFFLVGTSGLGTVLASKHLA